MWFASIITRRIAQGMNVISAMLLVGMVLVTLADVAGRAIFAASGGSVDLTFRGGIEMVSYGLLFVIFMTFPHSIRQAQVVVEMFTEGMGPRVNAVLEGVYSVGLAVFAGLLAWRFHLNAEELALSGETTQDLRIPLDLIQHVVSACCAVLALRAAAVGVALFTDKEDQA